MHRYHAVARAMGAAPFEVLATAAVRDARNGADFVAGLQVAHARRADPHPVGSAGGGVSPPMGVLCGIPTADGILADIGGGSLELVRLDRGTRGASQTLSLGAIRLAERAGGDPVRARAIAEADLADGAVAGRGGGRAISIWSAARGGRWRASTWRRPAIRCRWCTTTRSAARRRAI